MTAKFLAGKYLLAHGEVGPWFGRAGESYMALWAQQFAGGSRGLLHFIELVSLNMSQVLWTLYIYWASCLILPSSEYCCGLISSPHQAINSPHPPGSLVSASTEEESSCLYQASCSLTKAIL